MSFIVAKMQYIILASCILQERNGGDSDDSEGGNSLGYVDTEGNIFHIDDSTSKDSLAANIKGTVGEDGIEKYLEIGALLLLITGASYSTGKYIGSRKKN